MRINENMVKGKWLEVKGDIQKAWGKLTDDELDKVKGDMKQISGLIQQKYGRALDPKDSRLMDIFKSYEDKKEAAVKKMKKKLKK
jgi:uncharacterized protein YjbJ (UPF0337 family)